MKRIAILGSTGSIGCSSLRVIEAHPEAYQVTALAAGKNVDLLAEQVRKFSPLVAAVLGWRRERMWIFSLNRFGSSVPWWWPS